MLAVSPALQSRGFGSRIVRFVEAYFRALPLKECRLSCVSLREELIGKDGFYRKRGYAESGRTYEVCLCTRFASLRLLMQWFVVVFLQWGAAVLPLIKLKSHLIEFKKTL
jgi:hypothetical protein